MTYNRREFSSLLAGGALMPALMGCGKTSTPQISNSSSGAKRVVFIFFPNGVALPPKNHEAHKEGWHWFPHETGEGFNLTEPLKPLSKVISKINVLSGLSHPESRSMYGHDTADLFLTGADLKTAYNNTRSIDQHIAASLGLNTRRASLALSIDGGVGSPGRATTLSFDKNGAAIPTISNPKQLYNYLFNLNRGATSKQREQLNRERNLLSENMDKIKILQRDASQEGKMLLQSYLQATEDLEDQLERSLEWLGKPVAKVDRNNFNLNSNPNPSGAIDYVNTMFDMIKHSFFTDTTRVATFSLGIEGSAGFSDKFPGAIGLGSHHALTHDYLKTKNGWKDWSRFDQFLSARLAYFLEGMDALSDPFNEGSLLDNTLVLYGSTSSLTHVSRNYPLILAGGKAMGITGGRHLAFDETIPMNNLFVAMMNAMDMKDSSFGDSQGSLKI